MRTLLLVASFLLLALPTSAQETPDLIPDDIGTRVATGFARPAAEGFVSELATLTASLDQLCAAPGAEKLEAARTQFGQALAAWGRLSTLRFGPLVSANRFESIFFWPDTRGVTLRQVQALLAEADPADTDPDNLHDKSVAVQGLAALEYALFGTDAELLATTEGAFRCAYAMAVSQAIALTAGEVLSAWSDGSAFAADFTAPGPEADLYRSDAEVAGELVKAISTTLEFVRAAELLPPLGETIEDARGRRAPFWRSDHSLALVDAQLSGLQDLIAAMGIADTLTDARASPLNNLLSDLAQARGTLADIAQPAEFAFADADDRRQIAYAVLVLGYASETTSADLTGALGLVMGFNALDGD